MIAVRVGRNPSTSLYEVHKDGCRHLRTLEVGGPAFAAESAEAAATACVEGNDGIVVTLGSCVDGPSGTFASDWTRQELGLVEEADEWDPEEDGPPNDDWIHLAYERQAGDNPWRD